MFPKFKWPHCVWFIYRLGASLMQFFWSLTVFLISVLNAAGQIPSPPKAPINPAVDPFSIGPGTSFSASGGVFRDSGIASGTRSQIAADLLEAEEIIRQNCVHPENAGHTI